MLNKLPDWCEPTLQGIAYWLGYKKQFYRDYPLSEGAIVGEALQLIKSNLAINQKLTCEDSYKKLGLNINNQKRADIVLWEDDSVKCVVEVKRADASSKLIDIDICKLNKLKRTKIDVRCFLLIVSQNKKPIRFVNKSGIAVKGTLIIDGIEVKTRRVCKVTSTFNQKKSIESAHYACLIEVL